MKTTKKILSITFISILAIATLGACAYIPSSASQTQTSQNQATQNQATQNQIRQNQLVNANHRMDSYHNNNQTSDSFACEDSHETNARNHSKDSSHDRPMRQGFNTDSTAKENSSSFDLNPSKESSTNEPSYGASLAFADDTLTLEKMLTYAMEDEYLAHAEYNAILLEYGNQNPYSNIIKAEETHISMLTPLFDSYNVPLPSDTASTYVITPASLLEAAQAGVDAELKNIQMYDLFLQQELPDDVKSVFTSLKNASMQHLSAFERQVDKLS